MRTEIDIREKALGNYRVVDPGEAAPRARAGLYGYRLLYALFIAAILCAPAAPACPDRECLRAWA